MKKYFMSPITDKSCILNSYLSHSRFFDFPSKEYVHVGFGTINDSNGNPFKTRDGGNLKLVDLYEQAFNYIQKINSTLSEADLHCLTNTVLTYSDLDNK